MVSAYPMPKPGITVPKGPDIPRPLPTPANDNFPRMPAPANDNWPRAPVSNKPNIRPRPGLGRWGRVLTYIELGMILYYTWEDIGTTWAVSAWPGWNMWQCPQPGGGPMVGPRNAYTPGYPSLVNAGVNNANCISGQYVGTGSPLAVGYYAKYGPAANNHSHIVSYRRERPAIPLGPAPTHIEEWVVRTHAQSVTITAPQFIPLGLPQWGAPQPWPGFGGDPWSAPSPLPPPGHPPLRGDGSNPNKPSNPPAPEPGGNPAPSPVPVPGGNPQPPGPNVKERKVRVKLYGVYQAVGRAWGFATEAGDAVDAVHDALANHCKAKPVWVPTDRPSSGNIGIRQRQGIRKRGALNWRWKPGKGWVRENGYYRAPTLVEKSNAVYKNFECVDIGKAIENLAKDQLEDFLIGKIGEQLKKASKRKKGLPLGYGTGPAL